MSGDNVATLQNINMHGMCCGVQCDQSAPSLSGFSSMLLCAQHKQPCVVNGVRVETGRSVSCHASACLVCKGTRGRVSVQVASRCMPTQARLGALPAALPAIRRSFHKRGLSKLHAGAVSLKSRPPRTSALSKRVWPPSSFGTGMSRRPAHPLSTVHHHARQVRSVEMSKGAAEPPLMHDHMATWLQVRPCALQLGIKPREVRRQLRKAHHAVARIRERAEACRKAVDCARAEARPGEPDAEIELGDAALAAVARDAVKQTRCALHQRHRAHLHAHDACAALHQCHASSACS